MIYTFGYSGQSFDEFSARVAALDALVVDIRLVPQSRFSPPWRKANLEKVFKENYLHVGALGNKGFKEKRMDIADLDTGLAIVEAIEENLILLCACKDIEKCHRKIIADALREHGHEVDELPL